MASPVTKHASLLDGDRRPIMERVEQDHVGPEARLAEHQASVSHRRRGTLAPMVGNTVRAQLRRLGDERPTVRKMYDRTTKKGAK